MRFSRKRPPPPTFLLCSALLLVCFVGRCRSQTTNAGDARVVNYAFQVWGLSAPSGTWNVSGDICTGTAIGPLDIQDNSVNPAVKCDCSVDNSTGCRVTHIKAQEVDAQGFIPEELGNLTYLIDLNLGYNFLSGPVPAVLGNLTRMQKLSLGVNNLSGTIPKELGNLRSLTVLAFGSNNFTGPLPEELGKLVNLKELYIADAGVSGEIPSTFASLRNLDTAWCSNNAFTGKIPDFIGNWSTLKSLKFEACSFDGPIPSSFANLNLMTDLRISDVTKGNGSSLEFIRNMKSLSNLILRNNRISGSIPTDIGEYLSLQHLDLSFNNLTGQIPNVLINGTTLAYLFLGNNSLSGSLPAVKSRELRAIDLAYNQLSGSFPSWVSDENLELNLVANNFVLGSSNSSVLPSGLNCLQRNFPCNRGSPRYSSFAIKCGGPTITSTRGVRYEADNDPLGPASYFVSDSLRWAVSSSGRYIENQNATYTKNTLSFISNTLDVDIMRTARVSPSLRYYGLGLENGNYSVNMQFSEIQIENTNSWKSTGRRLFDVYVQNNLVLKDFNIKEEAGGVSFRTVSRTFTTNVTANHLDVHLFWAGKGSYATPEAGTYGPMISSISVTPNFVPTVSNEPPGKKNKTGLIVGLSVGLGITGFLLILTLFIWRRGRRNIDEDEELVKLRSSSHTYSYAELRAATEDFKPSNKLGEGGFGPVYRGTLPDGRVVAVKVLSLTSHQGKSQFVAEIAIISAVQHRNLVKLYGCCIEAEKRLLVYEYLENNSLDQALFGKPFPLDWPTRFDICLGTARGLAYLHEESRLRIVHRDVKASNILLDAELKPKISDFGLAKLYDDKKTHISTRVAGTIGYLAPEYALRGHLTEKADVFGFGVVALEILSGRPNADTSLEEEKIYLLEWAWYLHENNRGLELVDPMLSEFDEQEASRVLGVALLCTQASPSLRPPMSRVVAMLTGDVEVESVTTRPGYLTDWHYDDTTGSLQLGCDSSVVSLGETPNDFSSNVSSNIQAEALPLTSEPMFQEIRGGR
ncbi:probable LRR receptor-like serine/threonine-protein kinase At1g56140 [Aristolochia californica]|uniref:probable LRR receptor-like serine/threonine-protein kinase At1g56140 n=1 Tax=Aristolochia californica TaxID=171875 RepID=UPI0035DB9695